MYMIRLEQCRIILLKVIPRRYTALVHLISLDSILKLLLHWKRWVISTSW